MSVGRICVRDVDTAEKKETIQTVAERMHTRNVGTLVVVNDDAEPIGILTDRDLTVKALARGLDPYQTTVKEVMTKTPRTVKEDAPIERALELMRAGPYRRLPVVDKSGKLAGLISLDDVIKLLTDEFLQIGELLEQEDPAVIGRG